MHTGQVADRHIEILASFLQDKPLPGMQTQATSSSRGESRSQPAETCRAASAPGGVAGTQGRPAQKPAEQPIGEAPLQPTGTRKKDRGPEDRPSEDWGWGQVRDL